MTVNLPGTSEDNARRVFRVVEPLARCYRASLLMA
jgi:hypothetical protein